LDFLPPPRAMVRFGASVRPPWGLPRNPGERAWCSRMIRIREGSCVEGWGFWKLERQNRSSCEIVHYRTYRNFAWLKIVPIVPSCRQDPSFPPRELRSAVAYSLVAAKPLVGHDCANPRAKTFPLPYCTTLSQSPVVLVSNSPRGVLVDCMYILYGCVSLPPGFP
jgi:hypothetical protein